MRAGTVPGARHRRQDVAAPRLLSAQGFSARPGTEGALRRARGAAGGGALGAAGFGIHDAFGVSVRGRADRAGVSGSRSRGGGVPTRQGDCVVGGSQHPRPAGASPCHLAGKLTGTVGGSGGFRQQPRTTSDAGTCCCRSCACPRSAARPAVNGLLRSTAAIQPTCCGRQRRSCCCGSVALSRANRRPAAADVADLSGASRRHLGPGWGEVRLDAIDVGCHAKALEDGVCLSQVFDAGCAFARVEVARADAYSNPRTTEGIRSCREEDVHGEHARAMTGAMTYRMASATWLGNARRAQHCAKAVGERTGSQ